MLQRNASRPIIRLGVMLPKDMYAVHNSTRLEQHRVAELFRLPAFAPFGAIWWRDTELSGATQWQAAGHVLPYTQSEVDAPMWPAQTFIQGHRLTGCLNMYTQV